MGHRESQSIRDADEVQHGEVALAQLNLTDVPETQARSSGECRLGETLVLPCLADGRPKERQQRGLVVRTGWWPIVLCHCRILHLSRGEKVAGCGRSKWRAGIYLCEKPGGRNTQDMRDTEQRKHRNIALPQFDLADIRGTYARSGGECPMREPPLLPILTESRPKTLQRCVVRA